LFVKELYVILDNLTLPGSYTDIQARENMTSFLGREFISVQDAELLSIGPQPNSTLVVVGQLSMKVFLEP